MQLSDVVRRALAKPLDFPPLSAGVVPGDRVAVTLDEALPCGREILRGVVQALEAAGIEREAISVVTASSNTGRRFRDALSIDDGGTDLHYVVHDPDDEQNLCLVGVMRRGEPLLLNRTIYDADIVLPVGCTRLDGAGVFESLFPRFSSSEAIDRFRMPGGDNGRSQIDRRRETDEAGWLIGVPMVMQVVPGAGESVASVIAGKPDAVAARAHERCREQWSFRSSQRASLVIATVTGGAQAQNWENIGRAVEAAERLVAENGAVAICSNLEEPPGESLGRLIGSSDLEATARKILRDHADDSRPAWQLASAMQRGPVYFLSRLDAETVEDLGLAPVANVDELARLAGRQESYVLLEDSQFAVATVEGEDN